MGSFVTMAMSLSQKRTPPAAPADRNYLTEGQNTFAGIKELTPERLALDESTVPEYARLYSRALGEFMGGPEGATASTATANTASRGGDVRDISQFGPEYFAAWQAANPGSDLLTKLLADASGAIDSEMDPGMRREVEQAVRGAQAARGTGFGPSDIYGEAIASSGAANAWRQQNRAYGMGVAGLNDQAYTKPMLDILTRRSAVPGMAMQAAPGFQPSEYSNPWDAYSSDLYNTNYNAKWTDRFRVQARNAALDAQAAKSAGEGTNQLIGAVGCWVAREVYGASNPKWLMFRTWLLTEAPPWFRNLYWKHGENVARWLHDKPKLKGWIRRWMDARIKSEISNLKSQI